MKFLNLYLILIQLFLQSLLSPSCLVHSHNGIYLQYFITVTFNHKCLMVNKFKSFLSRSDLAKNTVQSYVWTVSHFISNYGDFTKENLLAYKGFLVEHFKPQTVNLRLQGINKYLEFINKAIFLEF